MEIGPWPGGIQASLRRPEIVWSNVGLSLRPEVRLPVETLQHPFLLLHLGQWIGVILSILEIVDAVQIAFGEQCVKHLCRAFVDSGVNAVLLQIEYGAGISQGIETAEDARAVEIGHHLSRFDLVEAQGIFLDNDECIGHQTGLFQCRILHHCINAVGCILTVDLIPYKR